MTPKDFPHSFGLSALDQQEIASELALETVSNYKFGGDGSNVFTQAQMAAQEIEHLKNVNKRWRNLAQQFMKDTVDDAMDADSEK